MHDIITIQTYNLYLLYYFVYVVQPLHQPGFTQGSYSFISPKPGGLGYELKFPFRGPVLWSVQTVSGTQWALGLSARRAALIFPLPATRPREGLNMTLLDNMFLLQRFGETFSIQYFLITTKYILS